MILIVKIQYYPGNSVLLSTRARMDISNYVMMFSFHYLYYATIGPVWYLVLFWWDPIRNALHNLLFIRLNPWCFYQNLYWSSCAIVTICCFAFDDTTFDAAMFYSTLFNTAYRSGTICNKYGTYPQSELNKIFAETVPASVVRGEMSLDEWRKQTEQVCKQEVKSVRWRENIADTTGDDLVVSAAQYYQSSNKQQISMSLGFVYAIFRALIFNIMNTFVGLFFFGEKLHEQILIGYVLLWQFMYFAVIPSFFLLAVKDLKRTGAFAKISLDVLDGQQIIEFKGAKVLIETPYEQNAAVMLIRKLDRFGDRMVQRHQAFAGFSILISVLLALLLIMGYFNIGAYSGRTSTEQKLRAVMAFDQLTVSIMALTLLLIAAIANSKKNKVIQRLHMFSQVSKEASDQTMSMQSDSFVRVFGIKVTMLFFTIFLVFSLAALAGNIYAVGFSDYRLWQGKTA